MGSPFVLELIKLASRDKTDKQLSLLQGGLSLGAIGTAAHTLNQLHKGRDPQVALVVSPLLALGSLTTNAIRNRRLARLQREKSK